MSPESGKIRHRNLPLLLLQAREHVIARFRPILNAHGITEQQWRIVRALIDTGPLEPREIGELCRISSPSLAGVLSRMEELGYIRRKRLHHDQRRVRVSLTPRTHRSHIPRHRDGDRDEVFDTFLPGTGRADRRTDRTRAEHDRGRVK